MTSNNHWQLGPKPALAADLPGSCGLIIKDDIFGQLSWNG